MNMLIRYYSRQMNKNRGNPIATISSTFTTKSFKNKENLPVQTHKTERKGSLGARGGLSELPINHFQYSSNWKVDSSRPLRQCSIEMAGNKSRMESSGVRGSRWLDNDKEMMQFILNLKSRKSQSKFSKGRKETQSFQIQDIGREDQKQLLCNHMLLMKKIQKYQKEAISYFYDKEYNKCFAELAKAESLLKKEKIDSPQHQLYINYLYAEFCFKLEKHEKWKLYLVRAKSFIHRIQEKQYKQMKEYILNLKALDACLALHEEQFQRVLELVYELKKEDYLSSKIRRRIAGVEVSALRKLCKYKQALSAIDQECQTLQTDPQVNDEKKDGELGRFLEAKIQITSEFLSTEEAIALVQDILGFESVSKGQRQQFAYYNSKIYHIYSDLLKKLENEKIKLIFFLEKWIEVESSKKQKLKIQLELFKILYEMGIYERALELFDSISCENVVYLGPEYLFMFASIKHFNGQEKEAISIMTKSIDICEDDSSKALHMFRLLQFDLEEEGMEFRDDREQMLEEFLFSCEPQSVCHVTNLYTEYLRSRNETHRLGPFLNNLKKTAQFRSLSFRQGRSSSKSGLKRGQK